MPGAPHPTPGPVPDPEPIEARLARAGLPPLARMAWLEIDLDALRGNLAVLRSIVGPGTRVEPVVKADAYGHGAVPVALALEAAGADGLSVATLDEAFELREAGVTLPLLVIYPIPPDAVAAAAAAGIAVSLGPGRDGERVLRAAAGLSSPLEVHLEVETGLGRGGVLPEAAAAAIARRAGLARRAAGRRLDAPRGRRRRRQRPGPGRAVRRGPGTRGRRRLGWGTRGRPTPPRRKRWRPRGGGRALGPRAHGDRRLRPRAGRARPAAGDDGRRVAPAPGHDPQGPPGPGPGASRRVTA